MGNAGISQGKRLAAPTGAFWLLLLLSAIVGVVIVMISGNALRFVDEVDYFALAQKLIAGQGYVDPEGIPTAYRPPGYPFLMALFASWSQGVVLLKLLNMVFLVGAMMLIKHLVSTATPHVAWLAGGAALAYPVWIYTASTLYPQTLCMLLLLAVVALLLRRSNDWMPMVGCGLLLGVLILVAPSFQLLAPFLGLYVVFAGPFNWRRNLLAAMLFAAVAGLTISPWLFRNYQVFDKFVPVATNGGVNLLFGNSEFSGANTGVNVDLTRYMAQVQGLNEADASKKLQGFAVDWVKNHPEDAIALYVRKLINYFNYRAELATASQGAAWKDWLMFFTYYPLLLVVAVRLMFVRQQPLTPTEKLLGGLYLCNAFLAAVFFTRIRFRLPFDGLLMAWAIISVGHLVNLMPVAFRRGAALKRHPLRHLCWLIQK